MGGEGESHQTVLTINRRVESWHDGEANRY